MEKLTILSILFVSLAFVAPVQASAAADAGVKPGSLFYFFDTTFENIDLFFTFNSKNKATKALGYADERLAEIEAIAEEKNPDAVRSAIANYESNIALATEKSKEVKDKGQAESLLTLIEDNASKNQEVLTAVLIKVPEEAREAIAQAIEVSKKGQEEATKQIAELKSEVEQLKKEIENLKKESGDPQVSEVEKLRKEVEKLKEKQDTIQPTPKQSTPTTQQPQEQRKLEPATTNNDAQKLADEQKRQEQELERARLDESRRQEVVRQEELRKQTELEKEKQLYQRRQQELDTLISEVNKINQQKLATEQEYRVQENEFIVTYCKKKEDELNNNFGARGLYMSGTRIKAIEDLKITCPIEARNLFNASLNSATYPFVVQLQNMQKQFREYNQGLYSACSRVSYNCSTYLDAAFPVNF